jgi:hypothetical protein
VPPLLEQRRVVDDEHGVRPADEPRGLTHQHRLERREIPARAAHEVVQLLVVRRSDARGERLETLPLPGPEEAAHVQRRPPMPASIAEDFKEWREPALELALPADDAHTSDSRNS